MMVKYRLLKYVVSARAGDDLTLGLLFWDGKNWHSEERSSCVLSHLHPPDGGDVLTSLRAMLSRAVASGEEVNEGRGSLLYWGAEVSANTMNPTVYYLDLLRDLRFTTYPRKPSWGTG